MNKKNTVPIALIFLGCLSTACNELLTSKIPVSHSASAKDLINPTLKDPTEGDASPHSTYTQNTDNPLSNKIHPPMSVTHKEHCETQ